MRWDGVNACVVCNWGWICNLEVGGEGGRGGLRGEDLINTAFHFGQGFFFGWCAHCVVVNHLVHPQNLILPLHVLCIY